MRTVKLKIMGNGQYELTSPAADQNLTTHAITHVPDDVTDAEVIVRANQTAIWGVTMARYDQLGPGALIKRSSR
jgi:hypothetical protein